MFKNTRFSTPGAKRLSVKIGDRFTICEAQGVHGHFVAKKFNDRFFSGFAVNFPVGGHPTVTSASATGPCDTPSMATSAVINRRRPSAACEAVARR